MGLEILIPLIWSAISPLVTEAIKKGINAIGGSVPPTVVPAIGTAVGAGVAMAFPELGMTETVGAVAGLGGTGVHQMIHANKYQKKIQYLKR